MVVATAAVPVDPRFARPACLFYVVGAQKAGTSWLRDCVSGHPQVDVAAWKEADYCNTVRPPQDVKTRLPGALATQQRLSRLPRPFLLLLVRRRTADQRMAVRVARGADGRHDGCADPPAYAAVRARFGAQVPVEWRAA